MFKSKDRPKTKPQSYYYRPTAYSARPSSPPLRPPKPHFGYLKLATIVVVVAIGLTVAYGFTTSGKKAVSKDIVKPLKTITHIASKPAPPTGLSTSALNTMSSAINNVISQNSSIDMSVSLIDLTNNVNQAEHYGDSNAFTAASTTKVITAADFLHEVEQGQKTLNQTINGQTAEYEIQQMIVISDDNAWDALNEALGNSQLEYYATIIGAPSFQPVPNTVTSDDMALVLQKLYEGQLLSSSNTQLLLGYMKQANYRQYIVPAIPSSDTIYHKIGLYEDNVHDEAIVTDGSQAFVIAIFTNGNGVYDWTARAQMMQQITQAALTAYFDQS